jgi:predicted XRE-type DNA-binding protein
VSDDELELVHGSGNVFRDFEMPDADNLQLKAILAAKIIGVLQDNELSTRAAERLTGVNHSEFSRIGKPDLKRFSSDRLIGILNKLGQQVEVQVTVTPRKSKSQGALHAPV